MSHSKRSYFLARPSRTAIGVLVAALAPALPAAAQLMAYEGFAGGPVPDLNGFNGGTGWSEAWSDQSFDLITSVAPSSLRYPMLETTDGCAATQPLLAGPGASRYQRSWTLPVLDETEYVSFLLRADPGYGPWGGLAMGSYPFRMLIGALGSLGKYGLMDSQGHSAASSVSVAEGQTVLMVVRITKNTSGQGGTYRLYVNPQVGGAEPVAADATLALASGPALPGAVMLDNGGSFTTDEIRVGSSWESVLPVDHSCHADLNHDGTVNGADIGLMLGGWGGPSGDINGDGTTTGADIGALLGAWGACPP